VKPGTTVLVDNYEAPVPVVSGLAFSKICGYVPAMALHVAMRLIDLSAKTEAVDPRFFGQPSGSGGPGTAAVTTSTAGNVQRRSRRRETAGDPAPAAK
jgi:hypothetical protein